MKISYYKEVNCTVPSPSGIVPCIFDISDVLAYLTQPVAVYYKSFMIIIYYCNDNGLYHKTMIIANLTMIVVNLALARSINYNHKILCKLKRTFTIVNYDPKPFIVQATRHTPQIEIILFVSRRSRKPRQVGVAISWHDINDVLANKLLPNVCGEIGQLLSFVYIYGCREIGYSFLNVNKA